MQIQMQMQMQMHGGASQPRPRPPFGESQHTHATKTRLVYLYQCGIARQEGSSPIYTNPWRAAACSLAWTFHLGADMAGRHALNMRTWSRTVVLLLRAARPPSTFI